MQIISQHIFFLTKHNWLKQWVYASKYTELIKKCDSLLKLQLILQLGVITILIPVCLCQYVYVHDTTGLDPISKWVRYLNNQIIAQQGLKCCVTWHFIRNFLPTICTEIYHVQCNYIHNDLIPLARPFAIHKGNVEKNAFTVLIWAHISHTYIWKTS